MERIQRKAARGAETGSEAASMPARRDPLRASLKTMSYAQGAARLAPSGSAPIQASGRREAAELPEVATKATGGGRPLDPEVRRKMEASFGSDFSDVRVHDGTAATAMGAEAYAQGSELHFGPGRYQPSSAAGQELIGHELTHVVQQRAGRVAAPMQGKGAGVNADPALEAEADRCGAAAARGEVAGLSGTSPSASGQGAAPVQRRLLRMSEGHGKPLDAKTAMAQAEVDDTLASLGGGEVDAYGIGEFKLGEEEVIVGHGSAGVLDGMNMFQIVQFFMARMKPGTETPYDIKVVACYFATSDTAATVQELLTGEGYNVRITAPHGLIHKTDSAETNFGAYPKDGERDKRQTKKYAAIDAAARKVTVLEIMDALSELPVPEALEVLRPMCKGPFSKATAQFKPILATKDEDKQRTQLRQLVTGLAELSPKSFIGAAAKLFPLDETFAFLRGMGGATWRDQRQWLEMELATEESLGKGNLKGPEGWSTYEGARQ